MRSIFLALLGLGVFAQSHAQAVAPTIKTLFKGAQYQQVVVSPDGSKLAIAYRVDDGSKVIVLDRASLKAVEKIDPGSRGEIGEMDWMGNDKLLILSDRRWAGYNALQAYPKIYLVTLGKKHPQVMSENFAGLIEGDTRHILVFSCGHSSKVACVRRVDLQGKEDPVLLATAPNKDVSEFAIDHAGQVRFALAWDKIGHSRLYLRQGKDKWKLLNDSKKSHVAVMPQAISRDNRFAYLDAQQPSGTDVIERYAFATGKREPMLRDPESDPVGKIYSMDGEQMIGAWYGPGVPHARYFHPDSVDAKWHRALSKSFPGSMVTVDSESADGNVVVVRTHSDRDPGDFYLLDRSTHKLQHLFRGKPWIDPAHMAANQPFTFKARDGLVLHGFVTMPTDGRKPAPMVVMVHGGPYWVRDAWSFDPEVELLATHGYAVLRVNFRGSGGSGLDFIEKGYRQWGRAMQDDVTDATRWAIQNGYADPSRICIYGGSYGGYAALMGAAREPNLYQCAIGLAGVYDLNKMYKWGDIHRDDYGMHYLKVVLGQDKKDLASRSPVDLADRIHIPVLLAHGSLDDRVPAKHAHELRRALNSHGVSVEYVEYDWEGHGLRRADDRKDFYTRLLDFLHAHLGGSAAQGAR